MNLAALYEALLRDASAGVDGAALRRETRNLVRGAQGRHATALPFTDPPKSCRLVVAPVQPSALLATALARHRDAALALLPSVAVEDWFVTPEHQLHVTLFHTGRTGDPRPLAAVGLAEEAQRVEALVRATPAFALSIERLLLTHTGVCVLLYQPLCPTPLVFRERMRAAFPTAPEKQAVILHSSLFRLMTEPRAEEVAAVQRLCEQATLELRGQELRFDKLWYILETALPIDGEVFELPCEGQSA